jgi:hypothetical protein
LLNALSTFVPVLGAGAYFSALGARRPTCTRVVAKFPQELQQIVQFRELFYYSQNVNVGTIRSLR